MQKRGQFYLITAIIIIALILSLATISNQLKKSEFQELDTVAEELEIEAQAVLDFVAYNNEEVFETRLQEFTETFASYTKAENLYFIFGTQSRIVVAVQQKKDSGTIVVNGNEIEIQENTYTTQAFDSPITNPVVITINDISNEFELKEGNNFYFIISEGEEEGNNFFTGNVVSNDNE